jgi:hypothetical protein
MSPTFAKLFDTPHGQLLVFMDMDNDEPILRVMGAPVRGVCPATSFSGWDDPDVGQRKAFDMTDQEHAEKLAAALFAMADKVAA